MKTRLKNSVIVGLLGLSMMFSPLANAALSEQQVRNFYDQLLKQVHAEDNRFFDSFQPDAEIHFSVPASWALGASGNVTLEEYKYLLEETWNNTENYDFFVDALQLNKEGNAFRVSADLMERYTLQGQVISTTNRLEVKVVEVDGKPKIAAYRSSIRDAEAAPKDSTSN